MAGSMKVTPVEPLSAAATSDVERLSSRARSNKRKSIQAGEDKADMAALKAALTAGIDQDGDGAMTDWDRFGNTIENVSSDWGTPLDGARSLKMYGQFNGEANVSGAFQNHAVNGSERFTASAHALIRSEDSIIGTGNEALLKIEFYSVAGAAYDSPFFLGEASVVIAGITCVASLPVLLFTIIGAVFGFRSPPEES